MLIKKFLKDFFYHCRMKRVFYICYFSFLIFVSCAKVTDARNEETQHSLQKECARKIELKYAKKFSIFEAEYGYVLHVFLDSSPQQFFRYYLVRDDSVKIPNDGVKINIPISRLAANTSTVFEFIRMLDCLSSLKATCAEEYIYSPDICRLIREGRIRSLGNSYNLNREILLSVSPDLLLLSDYSDTPRGISLPMVYSLEWKEVNALARAEWIKLWGVLYDKYSLADSLFQATEKNYLDLKELVENQVSDRPTLFAGGSYSGTWYLTGGEGFMAQVYADAGANFLMKDSAVTTISCGLEWMLSKFSESEYWLNCGDFSMVNWDDRLMHLKSVKNGNVYHFMKRSKTNGGIGISDFYESAVAHPDIILADVISIVHPQLLPSYESVYANKCEEGER